jgi:RNA polymerase sigma-70 factor (ECF subfamily)
VVDEDLEQMAAAMGTRPGRGEIPDRRLALMFACAHPSIDAGIRAPLMLQAIVGLDAATISSALLMSPAALSKRLVRAKQKIREAGIPLRVPEREELSGRLDAVLEAIYVTFAEGWSDAAGTDTVRRDLTREALFLARLVAELLPNEAEALGLLALMLYAEARRGARRNERGEYVPLARQHPGLWDGPMIEEAEALLVRASAFGVIGRYQLEAAVQSAHVLRCRTGFGNGEAVLRLYDELLAVTGSPVVAINRALAVAEVHGAQAGLDALPDANTDARLAEYQPYWATRAELLARAGASREACHAYQVAIGLERDPAIRSFLEERRGAVAEV